MSDCECYKVGGAFIGAAPTCEVHNGGSVYDKLATVNDTVARLRRQLAAAEQRAPYEADVAAQAIAAKEAVERERDALTDMAKCYYPTSWVDKPVEEWTIEDRANYVAGYWRFHYSKVQAQFDETATNIATLRTRAERAEAELSYIRRAFRGAVESDALAITHQTIGSYRAGLLKTLNALDTTDNGAPV